MVHLCNERFPRHVRMSTRHLAGFNAGIGQRHMEVLLCIRILLLLLHHHFCIYLFEQTLYSLATAGAASRRMRCALPGSSASAIEASNESNTRCSGCLNGRPQARGPLLEHTYVPLTCACFVMLTVGAAWYITRAFEHDSRLGSCLGLHDPSPFPFGSSSAYTVRHRKSGPVSTALPCLVASQLDQVAKPRSALVIAAPLISRRGHSCVRDTAAAAAVWG
ncbi:uncharacterized protein CC84DRAFT_765620 [Paraphaeosphaeria sporulosa]|uniref:Uncharacterized protein n=1 Tax=Paraphaeosphaeria sporulosa TaxID=1460663 RepID=A0A177CFW1_9PLEO|nr:uncharacterized protein CC84DRAFT_765620 [Paraphaeosphaeria sporulosa]OAG06493.1 hypothetical protein CC84DRAFT_765620 [Paraphaeosphaeria sporulosa]